jgi:hypothetical protein
MECRPEVVFLSYAFPCAQVLLHQGHIDEQRYEFLKSNALEHKGVQREVLEGSFKAAVVRLKRYYGEDYWRVENIRDYFLNKHNEVIDSGDGYYRVAPKEFCELCKVYQGRVLKTQGPALVVELEGIEKKVLNLLTPKAKPGDIVSVHMGFAVEVLA